MMPYNKHTKDSKGERYFPGIITYLAGPQKSLKNLGGVCEQAKSECTIQTN